MSIDIELVSHCYRYARSLSYQISGLVINPPKCNVQLTVYYNDADQGTVAALKELQPRLPSNVLLDARHLETPQLFRRAIGRNDACLRTVAKSCILCTDADYVWSGRAVDEVLENGICAEAALTFPSSYWKQVDHATGDDYLSRQDEPKILGLDPKDFEACKIGKAIGGIQVYRADLARELGYLNGTKWMEPHRGEKFACCRCDQAFRLWLVHKGYKIASFEGGWPWRIRHSRKGREFGDIDN